MASSSGGLRGCVEERWSRSQRGSSTATPQLLHYGIADEDAWDVGLPCGGEISIWVERYEEPGPQARFTELAREGDRAALTTVLEGLHEVGAKLLVTADDTRDGTLGDPGLDDAAIALAREAMWSERSELREHEGAALFVDVIAPPPRLIIFGAVDGDAACGPGQAGRVAPLRRRPARALRDRRSLSRRRAGDRRMAGQALEQLGGIDRPPRSPC